MRDFSYINARIRDFKAKGKVGGDFGLKVKTGRGITKITIGIAGLIEIWVGITGQRDAIGGSLGILVSNMIWLVEHLLP